MHDPSTLVQCDGRYYVYATGRGITVHSSADGYNWKLEPHVFDAIPESVKKYSPQNNGTDVWAPDIARINGEYYLYYSISSWGLTSSAIGLLTSPTLNPADPKYHWTDHGMIVRSVDGEKRNCIDPCIVQSPDGTLWLSYGSYIGVVEIMQLDPKTGLRIAPDSPQIRLSSASEASAIIHHGDYFYLLVNRGSCCQGARSTYNIRMGRSQKITGPYLDKYGVDMLQGGGTLFLASSGKKVGPGHFGLYEQNGQERFSCHYEFDADRGRSTLDTHPLLWTADGWPAAGNDIADATYQIVSKRTGNIIETPGPALPPGGRGRGRSTTGASSRGSLSTTARPATQPAPLAAGATTAPVDGNPNVVRQGPYITTPNQKWNITDLGGGYYKIVNAFNGKALSVEQVIDRPTSVATSEYKDLPEQMWSIEQTPDGTYRLRPKGTDLALTTVAARDRTRSGLELSPYKNDDDAQKWEVIPP